MGAIGAMFLADMLIYGTLTWWTFYESSFRQKIFPTSQNV
jgi:hypothetical protein